MNLETVYEDDNIIVVNKPSGLLTHTIINRAEEESVASILSNKYTSMKSVGDNPEERPGIVHRLDKDTSGLLLVCKNQDSFDYYKNLFKTRDIQKTYIAIVRDSIREDKGIIDKPIGIRSGTTKRSVNSDKMAKEAVTEYEVLDVIEKRSKYYSLLKVFPKTGRTHQIRVHLSSISHSVVGDKLYTRKPEIDELLLHAYSLEFTTQNGDKLKLEAEIPERFSKFFNKDIHKIIENKVN